MTTGRINQVAILLDVARRAPAPPWRAKGRESGRHTLFLLGPGRESPRPRSALGPRALHAPVGHSTVRGSVEHRGCFLVLLRPFEGAGWRLAVKWPASLEGGRRHKNQPLRHHPTLQQPTRIACRPFGGRARSQPAETIQTPLTRPHVPAFPTPPWQPHPASPWASEQMEAREAPVQHRWA